MISAIAMQRVRARPRVHAEGVADRRLQRDVARREDVGMAGGKQQIDFRRPRTDARHAPSVGRSPRRHRAGTDASRSSPSSTRLGDARKIARCLGRDRPASRNMSVAGGEQRLRRQRIDQRRKPAEDRLRAGARHLLRHDDRDEAGKPGLGLRRSGTSPGRVADARQARVGRAQARSSPSAMSSSVSIRRMPHLVLVASIAA